MSGLFDNGFEVSGLHNHLNQMSPQVMYMHYEGHGDALQLAQTLHGSVVQYTVPRAETVLENGHELLPAMGVATAINIQPSNATTASITGDFALVGGEVWLQAARVSGPIICFAFSLAVKEPSCSH